MKQIFFIGIIALVLAGCTEIETDNTAEYVVTCNPAGFDVTYANEAGGTSQKDVSKNEWSYSFERKTGEFMYVSAQANNANATITVKVYYQGDLQEESTSSGDYVIATASAG